MLENILLLHGALGTKEQFNELKDLLSTKYNVLVLNFEGHGDSISTNNFTIELFVDNVIEFLNHSKIEKTHIFGYSMGGYVALKLALRMPKLASKIITLGTKFNWSKEATAKEIKLLNPEIMEQKVPDFVSALAKLHQPNDWKNIVSKTAGLMISIESVSKLNSDDLKQIQNEVLIGIGDKDRMVTLEESEKVFSCLDKAQLTIIENTQHPIETVDKVLLANLIEGFINK